MYWTQLNERGTGCLSLRFYVVYQYVEGSELIVDVGLCNKTSDCASRNMQLFTDFSM
jgi:hypothetical protein